jgi:hypothetical protein
MLRLLVVSAAVVGFIGASAGATPAPSRPLVTAVYPQVELDNPQTAQLALRRVRAAGATLVRISVYWSRVASATAPPDGSDLADPASPVYDWSTIDREVQQAVAAGLEPFLTVLAAPTWAQQQPPGTGLASHNPNVQDFADFATAIATRYDGSFEGLPRVRYFQAWNEPNLAIYLTPQLTNGIPVSPGRYRAMLNAFYDAVHSVQPDDFVIAAGLAPFRDTTTDTYSQNSDWGPLSFMRSLLCVSPALKPTCSSKTEFDAWAMHPYTSGGPTHHAVLPNDVSLGDLPKMRAVLNAAVRAGHVVAAGGTPEFWVTEFSWDTDPPDPGGVPTAVAARWVAEALYRMWTSGVGVVTWFTLVDNPPPNPYQSGLYYDTGGSFASAKPKPLLQSFRFPFVAYPSGGRVLVWGRTPGGRPGRIAVEQRSSSGWRRIATLASNSVGIFEFRVTASTSPATFLRARLLGGGGASRPFSLKPVPDHPYNPFGGAPLEP